MNNTWTFIKTPDIIEEPTQGRTHYWHYNPELIPDSNIVTVKVVMPPGGKHDFHRHPRMDEVLYFIKGEAEQWVENDKQILKAGESVYIPKNVVHGTFNPGNEPIEFLAILTPSSGFENGTIDEFMNAPYSEYRKK